VTATPPDLIASLDELGLEQIEPGVVADTFSNRQALKRAGHWWEIVTENDEERGEVAVPWLRVLSSEEARRELADFRERRYECLEDQENEWSEYLPPTELLVDAPVPLWVKRGARAWKGALEQGKNPEELGLWLPKRCTYLKRDGTRCWGWAGSSRSAYETGRCKTHTTVTQLVARETFVKQVRNRLAQASTTAVDRIEALLDADSESVRLRAATEILDRVGVRAGTEVSGEITVSHIDATALVRERLEKLRAAQLTIEGEVAE
jgi:hypothetical protein